MLRDYIMIDIIHIYIYINIYLHINHTYIYINISYTILTWWLSERHVYVFVCQGLQNTCKVKELMHAYT